ncbi:protein of unknown function [Aminobacter niigataensis]|nr:protein of unknown function [Aminobacter niigataensis]
MGKKVGSGRGFFKRRSKINLVGQSAGGAEEDRTPDLVIANDALSQLSYSPVQRMAAFIGCARLLSSGT